MLHRRWLFLVWLAIVLNVLSPVLASARAAQTGTLAVELCSATAAHGSTVEIAVDLRGDGAPADDAAAHHGVAHCLYCPGFAAGFALAAEPALDVPTAHFVYRVRQPASPAPVYARSALRVADSRGPPLSSPLSS
ncbi:DUF2946 family protein [Ralstonia mannitolilytica]|uniref:DUF2946 domain-containing protein n=1 Tax=Ralstonia mannitolilytica TaxID=105219 RepID=A0AAD2AUB4_9RALS|nr:DUF2946 family protein [Ralstonia mannitolilytica]MBY4716530.1 DUF2946 domain-containing protein [Ralstonia mannitolilytica]CAJ0689566.1 hypothetical protein R77591_03438 [Ralstonia mannitolilytica]CAJ0704620.1 hypothetical protein LMG18102_04266 [Ralstonia mannitolilytica]CAJ0718641.1 hypothetical protein LMG8323_03986 [Ralstonia mannitolilytica]CAJ0881783.1 hypothetical protein R77569_03293 [Ralstonia mannitolilytica]